MRAVTVILQEVPHYRVAFLDLLNERLNRENIELRVLYGVGNSDRTGRAVSLDRPWARRVRTIAFSVWTVDVVWQSALARLHGSELIVVEQSNRLLINYLLQFRRRLFGYRLAFWGHGRNLQSPSPSGLRERWKRAQIGSVDWWFAYSESTSQYLKSRGFAQNRVTTVNNSSDVAALRTGLQRIAVVPRSELCRQLGCLDAPVALYCGALNKNKRIGFLLQTARRVRGLVPNFQLLVVGDGADRGLVESACREASWIHYFGAAFGADCAKYWAVADVALVPGPVGLVLVDSFAAERPLITVRQPSHGPEIAYLRSGENGLMCDDSVEALATGVKDLLVDRSRLDSLRLGCRESAARFSVEAMANNFASGVVSCLSFPATGGRWMPVRRQSTERRPT